jgi:hypothetical protein
MLRAASKGLLVVAGLVGVGWIVVLVDSLSGDAVPADIVIGIAAAGLLAVVVAWELADRDDQRRRLAAIERSRAVYESDERS